MRLIYLIIMFVSFLSSININAQDNISAVIDVRYEGVEIQRENTDIWLELPRGAIAFIGQGDTLRTDATGRVDILFDDTSHLLLLSNSDLTISSMANEDGTLSLDGNLNGNAVIATSPETDFGTVNLHLNDLTITEFASVMGIWSFADAIDAVTVAEGKASVLFNDNIVVVPAESGFFAEDDRTEAIQFRPEWHAAGLEASLYGCEGEVQTAGNVPLLVRTGPGQGYLAMGTVDVSRIIPLMGETETTNWTRVQFLTGFGWIRSNAVQTDCTDLPQFPDDAPEEKFVTVINVSDDELAILQPFFKSPADNAFAYQFVRNP